MKTTERLYQDCKILGLNHPVMHWQATNIQAQVDSADNIKPAKDAARKSANAAKRIDGMVCLFMAVGIWSTAPPDEIAVYETRGVFDWDAIPEPTDETETERLEQ
jgi:phage terminase large subunit-like protein